MRAKDIIPASKPRNPVVRQQQTSGAGAHRDKKKEQKQGYEKHKGKGVAEGSFGSGYGSVFTLYVNTGEKPATKTKTKKFKREDDAVLWAEDYADQHEMFPNLKMEIQDENGNVVWELEESQGVAEDAEPMDREFALVKKLGRLGERIVQNPKLWEKYDEAIDNDNIDWIISLIQEGTGATSDEVTKLSDLFGEIGGGMGRIIDFAWAVKEGKWEEDFMNPYREHRNQDMTERVRDPEDWDEGNTEPGNNFAVYINGKKWKVFPGPYGAYADSPEEEREFYRLKDMAHRKSQQTGKKWEVYKTGEPASK